MTDIRYYILRRESHPLTLGNTIKVFGKRYAYWTLRNAGATRFEAIRAIFFAI